MSQRAGIGVNAGRIRALGSEIRGGSSTRVVSRSINIFKPLSKVVHKGSSRWCALFSSDLAFEVESLLVLKIIAALKKPCSSRLRCSIQQTHVYTTDQGQDITLFSPSDVQVCTTHFSRIGTSSNNLCPI